MTQQHITIIAAITADGGLGRKGDMLHHLSEDLRRFKTLTMGHAIIMGRKTFESFPKGALPGRRNIVITRNRNYTAPGADTVSSLGEALKLCASDHSPFIIGGGEIYRQALPLARTLELTLIDAPSPADTDTFFPAIPHAFKLISESDSHTDPRTNVSFRFCRYELTKIQKK